MNEPVKQIVVTRANIFKRAFHFFENEKEIGTVNIAKGLKTAAESKFGDEEWQLNLRGFWKRELLYKGSHRPFPKGKLEPKWNGKLSFTASTGDTYTLKRLKWYKSKWGWYDVNDNPVLELRPDFSLTNRQGFIDIFQPSNPDLWLLVTLAWFNQVLQKRQAAAATT